MNKRFIRVVLFGALAFASTSTFVGCSDYDEDIDNLQQQINTNKDAIAKLQDLVGAGKWVTKVEGIEGGIKVTMNDGSTTEIKSIGKDGADGINGVDGKDGSVVEIRDGYWYIDGVNQNIKAKGDKGDKGETGAAGDKGETGAAGDKGETGATGDKGETGATGAAGADGHDVKVGANGKLQVWDATEGKYVDTAFEASGAFVVKDGNYWNLNVLNKDTNQYETIKLPATEIQGVTGLTIMGNGAPLTFKYDAVTGNAAAAANWKGPKGAPVENQVLFADLKPIIVQVTPYNFDLTTAKPQIVNSLGEEAPFTIDVKPYVSNQPLTRAASANGLWEITITGLKEGISKEDFEKALKVSANPIKFALKSGEFLGTYGDISFDGSSSSFQAAVAANVVYNGAVVTSNVPTGKEVTLSFNSTPKGVYDSYLTITAGAANVAAAAEYGIVPKGMSFTANEKAAGQTVTFTLNQMAVDGTVSSSVTNLAVTFAAGTVTPDAPITINYVVTDVVANQGAVVNFGTALTSISDATANAAETIEWEFTKGDGSALDAATDVPFKAPTNPTSDYLNAGGTAADIHDASNIHSNIKTVVKTTLPKNNYDDNAKPGKYIANFIIKDAKHNQLKVVPVEINVTLPSADKIVTRKAGFFDGNTLMARLSEAKTTGNLTFDMAKAYTYLNDAAKENVVMEDETHDASGVEYTSGTGILSATNLANFWSAQTSYTPTTMKVTYKVAGNANFAVELPSFDAKFVSALEGSSLSKTKLYVGAEAKEYQIGDIKINLLGGLGSIDLKTTSDGATMPTYVKSIAVGNGSYITAGSVGDTGLKFTVGSYGQAAEDNLIISIKDHNDVVTKYPVTVYFKDAPAS